MQKVRWGVLSTAKIGMEKVIPALMRSQWCDVQAIASRALPSARAAADALGIPTAYGSYEELLADPSIEAIYNPLPNDLHVSMTLAAARAGKHVLCEKPIALNATEAAQLREVADKVHIMEAFMVRFHPQWLRTRELVQSGALGERLSVQVWFSYFNRNPANIRNDSTKGGGALFDIGCYPIVAGRFLFGTEPVRVIALADMDPEFNVDRMFSALLDFGGGRQLSFTVSTQSTPYQRVQVVGTEQRVEIEIPFNAPPFDPTRIFIDNGKALNGTSAAVETFAPCDQYSLEGDAFSLAIRGESPLLYGVEDAIQNMRIIDALFASQRSGRWEAI